MWRLARKILILCMCTVTLVGCWSRKELDQLLIIMGTALDKSKEGYEMTLQVVDPSQMSQNRKADRIPILTYTTTGRTINEAARRITEKSSRFGYPGHMRFLVISEELAKEELENITDYLSRHNVIRPDFYIAVAKDAQAKDLMHLVSPMEIIPALELQKSLRISERQWAPTTAIRWADLLFDITTPGKEIAITALTMKGDKEIGKRLENVRRIYNPAEYKFDGIAVFRGYELLGYLDEEESKAYSYIINRVKTSSAVGKCPNGEWFDVRINRASSRIQPKLEEGKPKVVLHIDIEGDMNQHTCGMDLSKQDNLTQLEVIIRQRLREILMKGITNVQKKYATDIFGFGESFYRRYPKAWKNELSPDWNEVHFKQLPVEIIIDGRIRKLGRISSEIKEN